MYILFNYYVCVAACAPMVTSDLLEINLISLKAELKCALTTNGVLYVMTGGTTRMLLSLATN